MKKYLLFAGLLLLSACTMSSTNANNANPAGAVTTTMYASQFPDVPIPSGMKSKPKETFTTISSSGEKVGKESFSGSVEHSSLGATMAGNLKNQGWTLLGIVQSQRVFQLYAKGSRYLVITIQDSTLGSDMELWMISQITAHSAVQEAANSQEPVQSLSDSPLPSSDFDSFGSESLLN